MKKYALLAWKNEKIIRADFDTKEKAEQIKTELKLKGISAQVSEYEYNVA